MRTQTVWSRLCCSVMALAFCSAACTDEFDPPSRLAGLRALAVVASPPSGVPGENIELELVYDDATPSGADAVTPRPVEIAWLGGCHNPPGAEYLACNAGLERLAARLSSRAVNTPVGTLPAAVFGTGRRFNVPIPSDILATRPRDASDALHYGVSFVFFAACAGELRPEASSDSGVPLGCFVPGREQAVSPADFEVGYTTLYTFEGITNQNPEIESLALDGQPSERAECELDADCKALSSKRFESACNRHGRCVPVVAACKKAGACRVLALSPKISRASAEPDPTATDATGAVPAEILWVDYFGSGGEFEQASRLVNDRRGGFRRDFAGSWSVPTQASDSVRLWSVLRDNRGGVATQQLEIMVR